MLRIKNYYAVAACHIIRLALTGKRASNTSLRTTIWLVCRRQMRLHWLRDAYHHDDTQFMA